MKQASSITALLLLILLPSATASSISSYSADYNVLGNSALVQVTLNLSEKVPEFELNLPEDAGDVQVNNLQFKLIDFRSFKRVQIQDQLFDEITLSYSTSSVLEKTKESFFVLDLEAIQAQKKSLVVRIPEGATLKYSMESQQASIIPKADSVSTDGKRIIINWTDAELAKGSAVLVIYKEASQFKPPFVMAALGFLLIGTLIVLYRRKISKPAVPAQTTATSYITNDLTRNLFEDEKKLVEVLLQSGEEGMWQKERAFKGEALKEAAQP